MKITVKMKDDTVVICSKCHWSGAIEDAHWMQETEYGYCPACGSSEFDDLETWESYENLEPEDKWTWEWTWTGWKARVAVYALIAMFVIFGIFPWVWGVIDISNAIIKKFGIGI